MTSKYADESWGIYMDAGQGYYVDLAHWYGQDRGWDFWGAYWDHGWECYD